MHMDRDLGSASSTPLALACFPHCCTVCTGVQTRPTRNHSGLLYCWMSWIALPGGAPKLLWRSDPKCQCSKQFSPDLHARLGLLMKRLWIAEDSAGVWSLVSCALSGSMVCGWQARTPNALRLLQAACSRRIIAVPTTQVTARRQALPVPYLRPWYITLSRLDHPPWVNTIPRTMWYMTTTDLQYWVFVKIFLSPNRQWRRNACPCPLHVLDSYVPWPLQCWVSCKCGLSRLARMVQHPAVADVSKALWSFASPSQVFLEKFPQLVGVPYGELALQFADGTVLGLLNRRSGKCDIAPPTDTLVRLF